MRAVLASLLILAVPYANAADANHALIVEPTAFLESLADGPWGQAWRSAGPETHAQILAALPAGWQAAGWDGLQRTLATVRWADIYGLESDRATFATDDDATRCWSLLGEGDAHHRHLGAWTATRSDGRIVLARGADPGPGPLTPDGAHPAQITLDLALGRSSRGPTLMPAGSRLTIEAIAGPDGLHEAWRLEAEGLPVRPLSGHELAWRPAESICWGACGVDGEALRSALAARAGHRHSDALRLVLDDLLGDQGG